MRGLSSVLIERQVFWLLTYIGALLLPILLVILAVRLTHNYIGGVVVSLIVLFAVQPWQFGELVLTFVIVSFVVALPLSWRLFQKQKVGP